MQQLATAIIEIALRRRGPEILPDSSFLLLALLAINIPFGIVVRAMLGDLSLDNLLFYLGDSLLYLAFVFAVLRFFKLERRFRQTMSALLGIELLVNLIFLVLALLAIAWSLQLNEPPLIWAYLAMLFWWIFIAATVLARALSQPLIVGMMFVLLYLLVQLSISDMLLSSAEGDADSAVSESEPSEII